MTYIRIRIWAKVCQKYDDSLDLLRECRILTLYLIGLTLFILSCHILIRTREAFQHLVRASWTIISTLTWEIRCWGSLIEYIKHFLFILLICKRSIETDYNSFLRSYFTLKHYSIRKDVDQRANQSASNVKDTNRAHIINEYRYYTK